MAHRATPRIPHKRAPRVLYLGMLGEFSLLPLVALLEAGIAVCAVLIPEEAGATTPGMRHIASVAVPGSTLPLLTSHVAPSVVSLAWQRQIPVWAVARERSADVLAALASFDADALCVACWPRRLPSTWLALPRHGGLNLHPSLLPAHRGPAPLFWTLRAGDPVGVTVHRLDATLDGGDVLAQQVVETPDGMAGDELERRCAVAGGRLLAANVRALVEGAARLVAQNEHQSTYEPWPRPEDFVVTPDHPARWAFNFIRGTANWGEPHVLALDEERFIVQRALDYDAAGSLGAPLRQDGAHLWVQCAPGVLHVLADRPGSGN
jgi:methionyl-tRNA formyltransferase